MSEMTPTTYTSVFMSDRLFTPRFFVMCGFTFTVFLSAFQLLPTAPFRIQELGGSTFASGLFLGFLTYASAASAPLTGAIADRIGRRRTLIIASSVILLCAIGYGSPRAIPLMLALVLVHGVFWSGLLSASAAYLTHLLPERRRAEGIGYWGLSSVAAIAVAPPIAFWIMQHGGWRWICISCGTLNLLMGVDRLALPEDRIETQLDLPLPQLAAGAGRVARAGAVADAVPLLVRLRRDHQLQRDVRRRARRLAQEHLPDAAGDRDPADAAALRPARRSHRLPPRLHAVPGADRRAAWRCCRRPRGSRWLIASAIVFGVGFGTAYPVFVAYVMRDVSAARRGAAFGAILAAFDTGIGTGSTPSAG